MRSEILVDALGYRLENNAKLHSPYNSFQGEGHLITCILFLILVTTIISEILM